MQNNPSLTKNQRGRIETSISNVFKAISSPEYYGMHLRYAGNILECLPARSSEWRLFNDSDIHRLRIALGKMGY